MCYKDPHGLSITKCADCGSLQGATGRYLNNLYNGCTVCALYKSEDAKLEARANRTPEQIKLDKQKKRAKKDKQAKKKRKK